MYRGVKGLSHPGCNIIFKKQEKYQEVIELCQQAKEQGWTGDWDKRIADAMKKLSAH